MHHQLHAKPCQFLAIEVCRDFIPPCPVRISPAQAAALGPAIPHGCGTLAANSIPGVEQGTCQTRRRAVSTALSGATCSSVKCVGRPSAWRTRRKWRFQLPFDAVRKIRSMLRNMTESGCRACSVAYGLPLLRQDAQIVAVLSSADRSIDRYCRFEPAGIGGHDLLHHGDETLLIGLA